MNRFIEGGRLTDRHKNKINTEETLSKLNQIAYDKASKCKNKFASSYCVMHTPQYDEIAQICEEHGLKGLEKWVNQSTTQYQIEHKMK